ncbi:glycosyl hydrolase [Trinickia fusca]|uniref:Asl1-like glycosyl hydrolase catalytic domain-containing protein n=1 Tax=Trinickia fusca TaxID=2419777 RepID=A0A494XSC2_9BURK|nr:glycosyl hydrolase [Trinickia fusca]RKP52561.1 hypothetical protein D7S89_03390 [Trinickia fusca]
MVSGMSVWRLVGSMLIAALVGGCGGSSSDSGGVALSAQNFSGLSDSAIAGLLASTRGVNYVDGFGMDQLNCSSYDLAQILPDAAQIAGSHAKWVRVEASMTAVSGLTQYSSCPSSALRADPYSGIRNLDTVIHSAGAQTLLVVLGYHYSPSLRARYLQWLHGLLAALPDTYAFEIGNEENLANSTEGWTNGGDSFPYGWSFNASDFAQNDPVGVCPTGKAMTEFSTAVASYVSWLADTYREIKSLRPDSVVILGGLSQWQPKCFVQELDRDDAARYVDAVAYHPYGDNPTDAAASLDLVLSTFRKWGKPIWLTEFGFTTGWGINVTGEAQKALYLTQTYDLLRQKLAPTGLAGPIIYYTARDTPMTTAQWAANCTPAVCLPSHGDDDPAQIPGTHYDVSGAGLYEWLNGVAIHLPAYAAFADLP